MSKFTFTPVEEVHLHDAPLAKVLMQVQFSRTPQLVTDEAEGRIAEALGRYPVRRRQLTAGVFPILLINGEPLQPPGGSTATTVLLFSDPAESWRVTVTDTAVSLETTAYSTRDDFCDRALELFRVIAATELPPVVDRVGIRYIDRLTGDLSERVPHFVIPQFQGLVGQVDPAIVVQHSVTDSLIEISPSERLQVRSGLLPAGVALDPALSVLPEPSWVLDLDVYTVEAGFPFDAQDLTSRLRRYAESAYAFFRFATTDVFQDEHAGESSPVLGNSP